MIFSNKFLAVVLVLLAAAVAGLGALALSALGLSWYVAPAAVVAYLLGWLAR